MFYPLTNAHQEDGPSSERDRHFHLYRTLRGPAEVAPREGRDVRGRIGRQEWCFSNNVVWLGIGGQLPGQRKPSKGCRCSWNQNGEILSRKIISRLWCRIFKVLETFSGKISEKLDMPLDNIQKFGYTTRTTLESHLCCLRQNHCTCAGYALVNLCNPGRFVHVA